MPTASKLQMVLIWRGMKEYRRDVTASRARCRSLGFKGLFAESIPAVGAVFDKTFDKEGPGQKWDLLRRYTRKARARGWGYYRFGHAGAGAAHPILFWRSRLRESLTWARNPEAIRRPQRWSLIYGTKVPYAVYHHEARRIPRRLLFDLIRPDPAWDDYVGFVQDRVDRYMPMMREKP